MRLAVLWITVAALCEQSLQLGFARPFYTQFAVGPGIYGTNQVWTLGDVQEVVFDTPWPEYRIEFWQNSLVAGARLSEKPAYQQTQGQKLPQKFNWTVATNELRLSDSPVFFFWLVEVNKSSNAPAKQTSAFFNITEKIGVPHPTPSIGIAPTSTTTSPPRGTATTTAQPTSDDAAQSGTSPTQPATQKTEGLSTGAMAGIGVGVGIAAVSGVVCAVILCLNWRRKKKQDTGPAPPYYSSQMQYKPPPEAGGGTRIFAELPGGG
ncbi:hypothetical protein PG987_010135 [Apiospora arundinis]